MTLAGRDSGPSDGSPLVCLHGVTSHARHFDELAARLPGHRTHAFDLIGHGDSGWEPPWDVTAQRDAALASAPAGPAAWLGHSFGARIAWEAAAHAPERVERLVLLDPALLLAPNVGLNAAELARPDRSYASFAEAIDLRFVESHLHDAPRALVEDELRHHLHEDSDGRWRYRYCQSAVVAAYGEMTREPSPFAAVRVPTLLVLGEHSYLPYDHLLDAHRATAGELLTAVVVPGAGHTLLWDALEETVAAVAAFLG